MNWNNLDLSISGIRNHYEKQDFTPRSLCEFLLKRSEEFAEHNIWIRRLAFSEIAPYLDILDTLPKDSPLWGIPFVIKDNIDLAGIPTTAACEAYQYVPEESATVVKHLLAAGAIPLGKTNMDQFATGLVGTRSPFGICKNSFDKTLISGGSSSGSAVAVSCGLASFSLGTDTAGSGRVPAAFNRLVGMKPTKGLLSTSGVVPACRSLDVVSIFALNPEDAASVFDCCAQYDDNDPFSRHNPIENSCRAQGQWNQTPCLAIPEKFPENAITDQYRTWFTRCINHWESLGAEIHTVDIEPFLKAASLLYEGPWVSERYVAIENLMVDAPEALDPVVKKVVFGGVSAKATEYFKASYLLQDLRRHTENILANYDALLLPTTGSHPSIEEVVSDPIQKNSQLGVFTNFLNLLDFSGLALPYTDNGQNPLAGFTLVAPRFEDQRLLNLGALWSTQKEVCYGTQKQISKSTYASKAWFDNTIEVAVCGAHLEGQPLNWQLTERGAKKVLSTKSSENYRLFALPDGKRPAMVRDHKDGCAIALEVWSVPRENFGSFVANIPAPLGIGKVELECGRWVSGFICEHNGIENAKEISEFGGWREYLSRREKL